MGLFLIRSMITYNTYTKIKKQIIETHFQIKKLNQKGRVENRKKKQMVYKTTRKQAKW
jgi:hypothetical protein